MEITVGNVVVSPEVPAANGVNCCDMEECERISCTNNCEDKGLLHVEKPEELEVDVIEGVDDGAAPPVCDDDPEATEHSSSFGATFSGSDDGLNHDSSDMEAESNGTLPHFGSHNKVFRKKKVSDHWRKFIQPLEWRCRWIELHMKELNYQASKYDRELAVYNQEKQLQAAMTSIDKCAAREVSLTRRSHVKAMKRRKRKRLEDTSDIPSYMSNHTIFSYYDKKHEAEGLHFDDGHGNQVNQENVSLDDLGVGYEWPMPNMEENDKSLEQILLEIESLQTRVFNLTTQLSTIFNNGGEIFSTSGMSVPGEPHYSPSISPRCSPVDNGDGLPFRPINTSSYLSEFENEEMVMPGSAVSSYGDAAHPDIIESTVDLLSSAINRGRNLGNEGLDDILINNQAADEDLRRFEVTNHLPETLEATVKEEKDENFTGKVSSSETETDIEIAPAAHRPIPTMRRCTGLDGHLRRSKRKRKVRKPSPGGWNGEKRRRRKNLKKEGNS